MREKEILYQQGEISVHVFDTLFIILTLDMTTVNWKWNDKDVLKV